MGDPVSLQAAADELRYRAGRLRLEMNPPLDPSRADGKGFPVQIILAIAMLDAVNAEWEAWLAGWIANEKERGVPEDFPVTSAKIYERAVQLARHPWNAFSGDAPERLVTNGCNGMPAIVATVEARFNSKDMEKRPVQATGANLFDMKPLWAQFLWEARLQLEDEAFARGGDELTEDMIEHARLRLQAMQEAADAKIETEAGEK